MNHLYAAPTVDMNAATDAPYEPTLLAFHGRVGRLRFLVYTFMPMFAVLALLSLSSYLSSKDPVGGIMTARLVAFLWIALAVVTALRRMDDLDHSRWWGLLLLVPMANIFFWCYLLFVSGNAAANDRGPAPAPNTLLVKLGAGLVIPLLLGGVWAGYIMYTFLTRD
ncbi:DUF805 domain-containing protein [Massilia frigida]|nr:DUF805 domain-containing protein [Massilia frigida]